MDSDSPIADFYPTEFTVDLNGKHQAWQGVALLPFVDADRLVKAMSGRYCRLSSEEIARNVEGNDLLFLSKNKALCQALYALLQTESRVEQVGLAIISF